MEVNQKICFLGGVQIQRMTFPHFQFMNFCWRKCSDSVGTVICWQNINSVWSFISHKRHKFIQICCLYLLIVCSFQYSGPMAQMSQARDNYVQLLRLDRIIKNIILFLSFTLMRLYHLIKIYFIDGLRALNRILAIGHYFVDQS